MDARWRHLLWVVVLLRLVMPQVPASSLSLFNLLPERKPVVLISRADAVAPGQRTRPVHPDAPRRMRVKQATPRLNRDLSWLAFNHRVLQEALSNATRHAKAASVLVSIYNSMSERSHDIAVMRALGASRGDVRKLLRAGDIGRRPPRAGENTTIGLVSGPANDGKGHIFGQELTVYLRLSGNVEERIPLRVRHATRSTAVLPFVTEERFQVVLATREEPALGLHRLRLAGALTELRGPDLPFSLDETRAARSPRLKWEPEEDLPQAAE